MNLVSRCLNSSETTEGQPPLQTDGGPAYASDQRDQRVEVGERDGCLRHKGHKHRGHRRVRRYWPAQAFTSLYKRSQAFTSAHEHSRASPLQTLLTGSQHYSPADDGKKTRGYAVFRHIFYYIYIIYYIVYFFI